ncbi:hypothetical protein Tco_1011034 [Tanacetum coccineum]
MTPVKNVLALLEIEGVADIEIEKLSQHEDISIAGNETIDKQTAEIVRLKLRKQFGDIEAECEILPKKVMMQSKSNSAASSPAKLVSESVKMKQSHTSLLSIKQTLDKQLHQMNACVTHALKSTEEDKHFAVNIENKNEQDGGNSRGIG